MKNYIIQTKGLTKRFKKTAVVDQIDLMVPENSVYGFLGPNGAGKTTTIRMLLTLIQPSEGSVEIFGQDIRNDRKKILADIGSLVESPSLYGDLNGEDNLRVYTKLLDIGEARIAEVLKIVGLTDAAKKKVKNYSLGMKQRLGIALALLNSPKLLILDEPTNGLDPAGIREVRDLIRDMPENHGITVFVSSHLLSEVELMADNVGIINKGKIKFQGEMKELQKQKASKLQIRTEKLTNAVELLKKNNFPAVIEGDHIVSNSIDERSIGEINRLLVQNNFTVSDLHVYTQSLEDLFMKLTRED